MSFQSHVRKCHRTPCRYRVIGSDLVQVSLRLVDDLLGVLPFPAGMFPDEGQEIGVPQDPPDQFLPRFDDRPHDGPFFPVDPFDQPSPEHVGSGLRGAAAVLVQEFP